MIEKHPECAVMRAAKAIEKGLVFGNAVKCDLANVADQVAKPTGVEREAGLFGIGQFIDRLQKGRQDFRLGDRPVDVCRQANPAVLKIGTEGGGGGFPNDGGNRGHGGLLEQNQASLHADLLKSVFAPMWRVNRKSTQISGFAVDYPNSDP